MLKNIEITNFRCFKATKISGFKRVNLIGGQNNAGKTALLEAVLLNNCPKSRTIIELKRIRKEASDVEKAMPERAWDSFFFNQDKRKTIKITGTNIQDISTIAERKCSMKNFDYIMKEKVDIWNLEHPALEELKKFLRIFTDE